MQSVVVLVGVLLVGVSLALFVVIAEWIFPVLKLEMDRLFCAFQVLEVVEEFQLHFGSA